MGTAMTAFKELSTRHQAIEVARWVALLPVAAVAARAVQILVVVIWRAITAAVSAQTPSPASFWVGTALGYSLPQTAWVIAGSLLAPRYRVVVAWLLMLLGIGLSLLKHVVVQHTVGNHVGLINYVHFGSETIGVMIGVAVVHRLLRASPTLQSVQDDHTTAQATNAPDIPSATV